MKKLIAFFSFIALAASAVSFTACSSSNDEPEYNYEWHVFADKKEITKTTHSSDLFEKWLEQKMQAIEAAYKGSVMSTNEQEAITRAQPMEVAIEQAFKEFEIAQGEMDFGEGSYKVSYGPLIYKNGDPVKALTSYVFSINEAPRFYVTKPITPADLDKQNHITLSADDMEFEEGVVLQGTGNVMVYNDSNDMRIDEKLLIKAVELKDNALSITFEDLSGKNGKWRILQPAKADKAGAIREAKIWLTLEIK